MSFGCLKAPGGAAYKTTEVQPFNLPRKSGEGGKNAREGSGDEAYPVQQLAEGCPGTGLIVCQEASRQVWEGFFDYGIVRIHPQGSSLNDAEGPKYKRKVGRDVNGVVSGQLIQGNRNLRILGSTPFSVLQCCIHV